MCKVVGGYKRQRLSGEQTGVLVGGGGHRCGATNQNIDFDSWTHSPDAREIAGSIRDRGTKDMIR